MEKGASDIPYHSEWQQHRVKKRNKTHTWKPLAIKWQWNWNSACTQTHTHTQRRGNEDTIQMCISKMHWLKINLEIEGKQCVYSAVKKSTKPSHEILLRTTIMCSHYSSRECGGNLDVQSWRRSYDAVQVRDAFLSFISFFWKFHLFCIHQKK